MGQCASGFGHQGQDIRPGCSPRSEGADRCDPTKQAVVAVRDGILIRSPQQQAAALQINTRNEHIRFRYMHMNPRSMDADGILNGRHVGEGEKIGVVSNYLDHPNGTTRHLHFDVQVFTLLTPQTVGVIIRNLERDGAIRKTPHPVHGRVLQWKLTRRGRTLLEKCRRHVKALERRLMAGLSAKAQATVRRWLSKIAADLQQDGWFHRQ